MQPLQPLQIFYWADFSHQDYEQQRTYYKGFTLQGECYSIGDCVQLLPENAEDAYHLGCIQSAFSDCSPEANDSHSIEVRWFERFSNLFPSEKGLDKELVELEDVDINPIGCLVGRASIIRAKAYEDAELIGRDLDGDWFFSRGIFKQTLNQFLLYTDIDAGAQLLKAPSCQKRSSTEPPEEMADSDDACASRPPSRASSKRKAHVVVSDDDVDDDEQDGDHVLGGSKGSNGKKFGKGPGKQCVECGATQTPQWREGPAGPKTLCNACGVRYNRLRSSKRNGMGQRQQSARSKQSGKHASAKEVASSMGLASTRRPSPDHSYASDLLSPSASTAAMAPPPLSTAGGRPMRQAALLAANRTAAFARTGVFPMEDDGRVGHSHYAQHLLRAASPGGGQQEDDVSHQSSESAEELLFPLEQQNVAAANALLSAGSSIELSMLMNERQQQQHAFGLVADASVEVTVVAPEPTISAEAAASLMDLAAHCKYGLAKETDQGGTDLCQQMLESKECASPAAALMPQPPAVTAAGNMLRSVALRAVGFCPDVSEFGDVFSSFEAVRSRLPEDVVTQLLAVGEMVDSAANEAVAAEEALQAVEQIMSTRQKAADAARQKASDAVDRFKGCMADLLQQYSVGLLGTPVLGPSAGSALLPAGLLLLSGCGSISSEGGGGKSIASVLSCWGMDEHTGLLGDMDEHHLMNGGSDMMGASLLHQMDCVGFGGTTELIEVEN